MKIRSSRNPDLIMDADPQNPDTKLGDKSPDGSQIRPHIVWFGEAVPMMYEAEKITEQADILIVIGTSLNVYPAAGLVNYVSPDTPIYLIDPKDVSIYRPNVTFIKKGASEGMSDLIKLLEK